MISGITLYQLAVQQGPDTIINYANYNFSALTDAVIFVSGTSVNSVNAGTNITTSGTVQNPIVNLTDSPSVNNLIISGAANVNAASIVTLSAATMISGSTNLYNIFQTQGTEVLSIEPGSNILTGGTSQIPIISLTSSPAINNLSLSGIANINSASVTTFSADTINSGSTNLYNIFQQLGTSVLGVEPGSNILTGGTAQNPIINLSSSPSINSLMASGVSIFNALSATSLTATTLYGTNSGLTIYSSLLVYGNVDIFGSATTFNTQTVATESNTIELNLSGSHFSSLYGGIIILSGQPSEQNSTWTIDANGSWSANTQIIAGSGINSLGSIQSGNTDLYNIFQQLGTSVIGVEPGSNIITGGTAQNPIINLTSSPIFNNLTVSGTENVNIVSATTLSAATMFSGSTNLYNIFQTQGTEVLSIEAGSNILTGGTSQFPIINLAPSPSVNNLTISGTANTNAISATTFSAGTINSGTTNLYNIFQATGTSVLNVISGSNINIGGTPQNPIVNLVASPSVNNLTVSGTANTNIVSATTLSASTIISGATNLYQIFPMGTTTISGTTLGFTTGNPPMNSTFLGYNAGLNTGSGVSGSTFVGFSSGDGATGATNSVFIGNAGSGAQNAFSCVFMGHQAGANATNANQSVMIGNGAGLASTSSNNTVFIGVNAGQSSPNSANSVFVGLQAGLNATNASTSVFIGQNTGSNAISATSSVFIGKSCGQNSTGSTNSVYIGSSAGISASLASNSTFIGINAGSGATSAKTSIFIGSSAGQGDTVNNVTTAGSSILIGNNTSTGGFKNSVAIGNSAINTTTNQLLFASGLTNYNMAGVGYTMPTAQGAANTVLTNNGSGVLTWISGVQSVGSTGNILTGGTFANPTIGLTDSPFVNNFTVSGTENVNIISATTLSAATIISGSTNLYKIFEGIGQASYFSFILTGAVAPTTTLTTATMLGFSGSITPNMTGRINVNGAFSVTNNTGGDGTELQIFYGTGTAPIRGATLTGTSVGAGIAATNANALVWTSGIMAVPLCGIVTGLTIGTKYWIDIGWASLVGGTSTMNAGGFTAVEF